jgi:hypothetical protein
MHYVMAHESDEVKKETQALMGAFYVIDQIFGKFFC